ncbi:MAG: hypothetical protein Q4E67_07120, partial [Planctomycetia bacterium]|nr:hypothetical protein [Planctomycetia bacterium]
QNKLFTLRVGQNFSQFNIQGFLHGNFIISGRTKVTQKSKEKIFHFFLSLLCSKFFLFSRVYFAKKEKIVKKIPEKFSHPSCNLSPGMLYLRQ